MNKFESNPISFLLESVDKVGADLVAKTYQNLVSHYSAVFFTLTAVYIGFVFIKMKRGHYDSNDFIMLILRAVIILTLAMNYEYFCLYLYNVFTNEPLIICQAITVNGSSTGSASVSHALDNFINGGMEATKHVFSMGGWSNPTYLIFGALVFILVLVAAAIATGLIVMAKCATTVLLALSPIFIFFALYDSTKGLFESYLRQLITFALIPIMTSAVLMILLSVVAIALSSLQEHVTPNIISLLPLCLMCIIQMYLLLQIKGKCSALAGGISLPSVISALKQSKSEMASAANGAASLMQGIKSIGSRRTSQTHGQQLSRFNKE
jgi:type IV secretory pathway VirB6-like protein